MRSSTRLLTVCDRASSYAPCLRLCDVPLPCTLTVGNHHVSLFGAQHTCSSGIIKREPVVLCFGVARGLRETDFSGRSHGSSLVAMITTRTHL